jgi:hypothetical protein
MLAAQIYSKGPSVTFVPTAVISKRDMVLFLWKVIIWNKELQIT